MVHQEPATVADERSQRSVRPARERLDFLNQRQFEHFAEFFGDGIVAGWGEGLCVTHEFVDLHPVRTVANFREISDFTEDRLGTGHRVFTKDSHASGPSFKQPEYVFKECGLPGSVFSDEADKASLWNGQVYFVECTFFSNDRETLLMSTTDSLMTCLPALSQTFCCVVQSASEESSLRR